MQDNPRSFRSPLGVFKIDYNAQTSTLHFDSINVTPPAAGENITGKAGLFQVSSAMFNGLTVTATVYITNNDTTAWTGVEMQAYTLVSGSATAYGADLGSGWYTDSPSYGAWAWLFTSGTVGTTFTIPAGEQSANKVIGFNATSSFDAVVYIYADVPVITEVTPTSGSCGSLVTIAGYNFSSTQNSVTFNGIPVTIQSWTDTSIVAALPTSVTSGNVIVNTGDPNTPYSNPFVFTSPPPPPTNLQDNVNTNNCTVTLTWSASSDALSYNVYEAQSNGPFPFFVKVYNTTLTTYTTNIPIGTYNSLCFEVTSVGSVLESCPSNFVCFPLPVACIP
jgi:IPT/TIG domain